VVWGSSALCHSFREGLIHGGIRPLTAHRELCSSDGRWLRNEGGLLFPPMQADVLDTYAAYSIIQSHLALLHLRKDLKVCVWEECDPVAL